METPPSPSARGIFFLKCLFGAVCVLMIGVSVAASLSSNLFEVFPGLLAEPWVSATLVDFYLNILILSAWVIYKEKEIAWAVLWIALFVFLGSIATSFYVLLQLFRLKPGEPVHSILLRQK